MFWSSFLSGGLKRLRFSVVIRNLSDKRPKFTQQFQQQLKHQKSDPKNNLKGIAKELERFANKQGRDEKSQILLYATLVGVIVYEIAKITILKHWMVKQFKHSGPKKTDDFYDPTHELDRDFQQLLDQVMKDMKISLYDKEKFRVFFTDNLSVTCKQLFTPISALRFKAALGIPYYANFTNEKAVDLSQLKHKTAYVPLQDPVQMDLSRLTDDGNLNELKATFILSDDAKMFLLATQSYEMCSQLALSSKLFEKSILVILYATLTSSINSLFKMFKHPLIVRLGMYMMCFAGIGLSSIAVTHIGRTALDETLDQMACQLGPQYSQGGVEFFNKAIKRAQLLRENLPEAKEYFDENGDLIKDRGDLIVIRPLKSRLAMCEENLRRHKEGLPIESTSLLQTLMDFEYNTFAK